ncbi:MAG: hypothetical protein K9M02_02655 [Thiohalocapsa sp.]|jgi:hypothetical protein|nr:hypothetical protein [Thiohalocapsa sp.]
MKHSSKAGLCLLLTAMACLPAAAVADKVYVQGQVVRVLVSAGEDFGGCMAQLSRDPGRYLNCGANWVTFSCTGDFTDPVRGYRMLDQAQLALATGRAVGVEVTDSKKHNGYCFAQRIDVIR